MKRAVWKTELKRHLSFFITIYSVELIIDIFTILGIFSSDGTMDTVHLFWQMLSWIAAVFYVMFNCYTFFMLGKDRMLHLLPVSRPTILVMKSVIFAGYMYVYFIIQLTRYLAIVPPEITSSKFQLSTIYALSKLLSIVVFFTLILALMLTLKNIENKVIAALAFAMLLITVIAIQGVALYQYLSNFRPTDWIIGIVEDMKGMNQYINIIPINFVPKDGSASFVEQTFSIMSVVLNLIVLSISSTLFFVQAKFRKYNYLEY